jgi:UDP-N-acetylmuramyl pentapeptide phosphotransferase/UDP-N-acetylglucosamine-1-phosphate transferase
MYLYSIILIIVFLLSFLTTAIVRKIAIRKSIIDYPNERSSHSTPTPLPGGLAIVVVWYGYLFYGYKNGMIDEKVFLALLPGIFLVVVGFLDDLKGLSPFFRIVIHFIVAISGLMLLGGINHIDLGIYIIPSNLLVNILVLIGIVWWINIFNFLDGIDGYLGSEGLFVFLGLFVFVPDFSLLVMAVCILGFLIWNWPKAKIFCGDVGSTLIGYTVAVFAIYYQNANRLSILIPIILCGLFWMDATITLMRRMRNHERILLPHKKNACQRLNQAGFSHQKILLMGWAINILLFILALTSYHYIHNLPYLFVAHTLVVFGFIRYADRKKKFENSGITKPVIKKLLQY